jgi:hypothetical protein
MLWWPSYHRRIAGIADGEFGSEFGRERFETVPYRSSEGIVFSVE